MPPQYIVLQVFALLIGITFHEFGHAYAADKAGDPTPRAAGRVTLNPIKHLDLFGTIIFPALLIVLNAGFVFGWAKPVPVNPMYMRGGRSRLAVAFAGVLNNMIIAVIFGMLGRALNVALEPNVIAQYLFMFCYFGVIINLILAFFNLIPVPPLDGGRILMELLPEETARGLSKIEPFGILILLVLFQLDILDKTLFPLVTFASRTLLGM